MRCPNCKAISEPQKLNAPRSTGSVFSLHLRARIRRSKIPPPNATKRKIEWAARTPPSRQTPERRGAPEERPPAPPRRDGRTPRGDANDRGRARSTKYFVEISTPPDRRPRRDRDAEPRTRTRERRSGERQRDRERRAAPWRPGPPRTSRAIQGRIAVSVHAHA